MKISDLQAQLRKMDGASYGALKRLTGSYTADTHALHIDKVQSDPYAPPSKIRISLPVSRTELPTLLLADGDSQVAVRDFIARDIADAVKNGPREFSFVTPGQEILDRSSVVLNDDALEVRLTFKFPAAGRRVKGRLAAELLTEDIPDLIRFSALGERLDVEALNQHVETYLDFLSVQRELEPRGLVAFVANEARLPRRAGNDDRPAKSAVAFTSPTSLETSFELPSGKTVTGMGIPRGVNLIVGGGFHGKSTLLKALERGVYAHIPGDGRELVVTDASAVAVRAEDGRSVTDLDISPFIRDLPGMVDTSHFSTANASGSTSQAANTVEAIQAESRVLLLDEDTCATNFMIRDDLMSSLVADSKEPIKPLVSSVRALASRGISTIIVMGGSGAYLSEADTVISMTDYLPDDVTARAHELAGSPRFSDENSALTSISSPNRNLGKLKGTLTGGKGKPPRARGLEQIQLPSGDLDLRYVSQLVDAGQTQVIALLLPRVVQKLTEKKGRDAAVLAETVEEAFAELATKGYATLGAPRGDLVLPRPAEVAAAINRLRA